MTPREQVLNAVQLVIQAFYQVEFSPNWDDYYIAGRGMFTPQYVMLHHTAGTNSLGPLTTSDRLITGPGGGKVPGAHFLVQRDGTVIVLSCFTTYHAGFGNDRNLEEHVPDNAMNPEAWGIEIEDRGLAQTMTIQQIESASALTAGLLQVMDRTIQQGLIQHREWSTTGKPDTLYPTSFWAAHVAKYMVPIQEDDMALTEVIAIDPTVREILSLEGDVTVRDALALVVRDLAVDKRTENTLNGLVATVNKLVAGQAALIEAFKTAGPGIDPTVIEQAAARGAAAALAELGERLAPKEEV